MLLSDGLDKGLRAQDHEHHAEAEGDGTEHQLTEAPPGQPRAVEPEHGRPVPLDPLQPEVKQRRQDESCQTKRKKEKQ